jgi:hypothetical protein
MAAWVGIAAIWGYSAWAAYHLDRRGWWLAFITFALLAISGFITYSVHDISEVYRLMGYKKEVLDQMQKYPFFKGQMMAWLTLLSALPWLGYLLWVRKFFRRSE